MRALSVLSISEKYFFGKNNKENLHEWWWRLVSRKINTKNKEVWATLGLGNFFYKFSSRWLRHVVRWQWREGCQSVCTPGLGSRLSTKWHTKGPINGNVGSTPSPCVPVVPPGLKPKRGGGVWRADAPALINRTALAWTAKWCLSDCGSSRPGWMPPQVQVSTKMKRITCWIEGVEVLFSINIIEKVKDMLINRMETGRGGRVGALGLELKHYMAGG